MVHHPAVVTTLRIERDEALVETLRRTRAARNKSTQAAMKQAVRI